MEIDIFNDFQRDLQEISSFQNFINFKQIAERVVRPLPHSVRKFKTRRRFNPLQDLGEHEFRHSYRYSKENMRRLIEMVRDDLEVETHNELRKNQVPVDRQIMAAIRYWGMTEHPDITARLHGVSLRTLMKISKRVAEALASKTSRYIRMPCLLAEKEKVTQAFYRLAHMPQVIGAVAHSRVKCKRLQHQGDDCKGDDIMHIQIVSDASLKIRDIDCRLVISQDRLTAADLFSLTRIKERFEQTEFRGRILLGDSTLQCTSFLYTPVTCAISGPEQSFNHSLRLTYEPVQHCFKLWKKRFGILSCELRGSVATARHIIVGSALLHNMAIEWNDPAFADFHNSLLGLGKPVIEDLHKCTDVRGRTEFIKNHFCSSLN
uniref:DDE Tnp4 domain-containing protein n=1 Tax=Glossina brevipalpis TaxID=37001 RepID=A0A1A9W0S5_9MUSC